jgi:hypothetical protein
LLLYKNQKRTKGVNHPVKYLKQRNPNNYQRNPHGYCTQNANRQDLLLVSMWDSQRRKNQQKDKNILSALSVFSRVSL